MKLIETICYECLAGSVFDTFAEEVIMDVKRHERDSLMTFNGAFIRVKQDSTVSDLWEEYQKQCKDAVDLIRLRNKESQLQVIELFGKRVKIVEDTKGTDLCEMCAFCSKCDHINVGSLCEDSNFNCVRHFVEVDEDGKELNK